MGTYPIPLSVKGVATNDFGFIQQFITGKLLKWHNERLTNSVKANTAFTRYEAPSLDEGMRNPDGGTSERQERVNQ